MVVVSLLGGMGVVALLLVFESFVALVLLFGSMDNQVLVGLVPELMLGLVFVLDVELVLQLAYRLV